MKRKLTTQKAALRAAEKIRVGNTHWTLVETEKRYFSGPPGSSRRGVVQAGLVAGAAPPLRLLRGFLAARMLL